MKWKKTNGTYRPCIENSNLKLEEKDGEFFVSFSDVPFFAAYKEKLKAQNLENAKKESLEMYKKCYRRLLDITLCTVKKCESILNAIDGLSSPEDRPTENEFMAAV